MKDHSAPCMGCLTRLPGCHSTCQNYLKWQQNHNARLAIEKAAKKKIYEPYAARDYCVRRSSREKKGAK